MASARGVASTQEVANSQGVVLGTLTGTVAKSESGEGVANTAVAPSESGEGVGNTAVAPSESAEVGTSTKEDATKSPGVTTEVANPGLGLTWESF